jgi:hypothetical protein
VTIPGSPARVVYDNTTHDRQELIGLGPNEVGSQITLAGTDRVVEEFLFGYSGYGSVSDPPDVNAHIKFYVNDGPNGAPGTVLFESGPVRLNRFNLNDVTLSGLGITVPDTFTWTIAIPGIQTKKGLEIVAAPPWFGPATIGSDDGVWYLDGTAATTRNAKQSLRARVTAKAAIARPGWAESAVQILAGVINDGGGLIQEGGHIIHVPPQGPLDAIFAALPAQLTQRLRPLVEAAPQGDKPEATLRQQLLQAIAAYQKEFPAT